MIQELIKRGMKFIEQMELATNAARHFIDGNIFCSEPNGAMYYATEEQKATIAELESKGLAKVWHIIKGAYKMNDGNVLDMETYLMAIEEFDELEPWNDGGYLAHSYVKNLSWGEGEYGDVVIKPHNGGLIRIM